MAEIYCILILCPRVWSPEDFLFHEMGTANKKQLDLKRGTDSTQSCPKP